MTNHLPRHLHIVHMADHRELAHAIKTIVEYQRIGQRNQVVRISEAKNAATLAELLVKPAAVVMFTGHGTPDGRIGTQANCDLQVDRIATIANYSLNTYGLIMDSCHGWEFRDAVRRQASRPLAYLAACGEAVYADTQVIANVAISLAGNPGKPLPLSADDADYAFCQALAPARGLWRHGILQPGRDQ